MEAPKELVESLPPLDERQARVSQVIINAINADGVIQLPDNFEHHLAIVTYDGQQTPAAPIWWGAGHCYEHMKKQGYNVRQMAALFKAGIAEAEAQAGTE